MNDEETTRPVDEDRTQEDELPYDPDGTAPENEEGGKEAFGAGAGALGGGAVAMAVGGPLGAVGGGAVGATRRAGVGDLAEEQDPHTPSDEARD